MNPLHFTHTDSATAAGLEALGLQGPSRSGVSIHQLILRAGCLIPHPTYRATTPLHFLI